MRRHAKCGPRSLRWAMWAMAPSFEESPLRPRTCQPRCFWLARAALHFGCDDRRPPGALAPYLEGSHFATLSVQPSRSLQQKSGLKQPPATPKHEQISPPSTRKHSPAQAFPAQQVDDTSTPPSDAPHAVPPSTRGGPASHGGGGGIERSSATSTVASAASRVALSDAPVSVGLAMVVVPQPARRATSSTSRFAEDLRPHMAASVARAMARTATEPVGCAWAPLGFRRS